MITSSINQQKNVSMVKWINTVPVTTQSLMLKKSELNNWYKKEYLKRNTDPFFKVVADALL